MNRLPQDWDQPEGDDESLMYDEFEAVMGIPEEPMTLSEKVQQFAWEIAASIIRAPDMSMEVKRMLSLQAEPMMEWHPGQLATLQMTVCVQEFQRRARDIYMAEVERQKAERRGPGGH